MLSKGNIKTHTFMVSWGENISTLEDVQMLLGLTHFEVDDFSSISLCKGDDNTRQDLMQIVRDKVARFQPLRIGLGYSIRGY